MGRDNEVDHLAIPAACFTHPEIAMVGLTEEQAKEKVTHLPLLGAASICYPKRWVAEAIGCRIFKRTSTRRAAIFAQN